MTIDDVTEAWARGKAARVTNLAAQTDGALVSYATPIARIMGRVAFVTTRKYSTSTSRHTNLAIAAARRSSLQVERVDELPTGPAIPRE